MKRVALAVAMLCLSAQTAAAADDYRIASSKEAPPAGLAKAIVEKLEPASLKITKGENRTAAEIWLCREWPINPSFKPTSSELYPFPVGELVGAIRFKRKSADFKGQEIPAGVYTLRYAQQPVDGNHVGTSITRDFLLLLPAEADTSPGPLDDKAVFKLSEKAAQASHPAVFSLVKPEGPAKDLPAMRHQQKPERWIACFAGHGKANGKAHDLAVNLVIVGKGGE
jgi:hypothetical protein